MTFTGSRIQDLPAIRAQAQEYEHEASGARHIHLATDNPEMVFLVAFPTLPDKDDGCAHVLEHLVLCGSARFPVRDPFFAMRRRSTAHYMNAITSADRTVYPFACTDRTDFFNLLEVYLDATFFPRLEYLDFLQEGWRLALDGDNPGYHGVVFNEMKGAFPRRGRILNKRIRSILLEGTTYAVDSGGDPLAIPSLTYESLKSFYEAHYHPSQAVFMTAGCIDPRQVQDVIAERVLSKLSGRRARKLPQLAAAWAAPKSATFEVPGREHAFQFAWRLGETTDCIEFYNARLLTTGLIGNSSAPVWRAMENAGFGRPSGFNGMDDHLRQIVFHLGMEGLKEDQLGNARECIWEALERAARVGVSRRLLHASLRNSRFNRLEVSDSSPPHAIRQLLLALRQELRGGDVMDGFDVSAILDRLEEETADPEYFKGLARDLLDSATRLDATVIADPDYLHKRRKVEEERLAALARSLSEADRERLRAESAALLARQRLQAPEDVLPCIRPRDVSPLPLPQFALPDESNGALAVSIPSNGISYAKVMYDVSDVAEEDWPWLQFYVDVLPELGLGGRSYARADAWRRSKVPCFALSLRLGQLANNGAASRGRSLNIGVDFFAKGLREENRVIAEALSVSIRAPRFDEHARLAYLVDRRSRGLRERLAENGPAYASRALVQSLSLPGAFRERVSGVPSLAFYRQLRGMVQAEQGRNAIFRRLGELHERIVHRAPTIIVAAPGEDSRALIDMLDLPQAIPQPAPVVPVVNRRPAARLALHAPAEVNHCYAAWPVPDRFHPDSPVLNVLGRILTNGVLHRVLREQGGAYGGRAEYYSGTGIFVMGSHRDPHLAATYDAFRRAISWVMDADLTQKEIDEAIIGVVKELDAPSPPYARVMEAWERRRYGITEDMRRRYRQAVLGCTAQALKEAAASWLLDRPHCRSAFVGKSDQDLAGLELVDLTELVD